jgi:phage-related baseplate assembly protein
MYVLGLDTNGNLAEPTPALLQNVQTYIQDYRMLTDAVKIQQAYIVNIGVSFDVVILPNYNGQDVISRCITAIQNFFDIDNWQINQPIILTNLYSLLDQVQGVQTIKNISITNLTDPTGATYSPYAYDIAGATVNNVIYPSLDPCIFEVLYPNTDIQGRVVTF